jgi:quinol monooxygenase YgiN
MAKRFARIITMKAKPGKGDEFLKRFKEGVASTAADIDGIRKLYLFRPVGRSDEFVAISLWDDEDAAERYAGSGRNQQYGRKLAAVQRGKERVKKFHVELHVVGKGVRED